MAGLVARNDEVKPMRWIDQPALVGLGVIAALTLGAPMSSLADCPGQCAGWEAVEEYNGTNSDLPATVDEGEKFEQAIADHGVSWITDFSWRSNAAWERDFKEPSQSGTDDRWVDDVDLVLFAGHGNSSGVFFGVNQDDLKVHWNESTLGDKDLEWLILDACQVLKDDSGKWGRWGWPVFEALHYIFGYSTNTFDVDTRGEDFEHRKFGLRSGVTSEYERYVNPLRGPAGSTYALPRTRS